MQSYQIIERHDPEVLELLDHVSSSKICDFNQAKILELKGGQHLLMPKIGKYVILYEDYNKLNEHISTEKFPVPIPETDSVFELEKENLFNINSTCSEYITYVQNKFNLHDKDFNSTLSDSKIESLSVKVNRHGLNSLSDYDILAIGIYVSEILRMETSLEWNLDLIYTLNTYWALNLKSSNNIKIDLIGHLYKSIREDNTLELKLLYRMEMAKYLGYETLSKKYMEFVFQN
ncbi:MAG: hypothetical protein KTR22_06635 [Flavobacteriaceae bacterium]|nr:hypothetical protein [Flavobacteriaceae bacterium]